MFILYIQLSQAEIIAARLRAAKTTENVESELDKAASELLKMMEDLGMQGIQVCLVCCMFLSTDSYLISMFLQLTTPTQSEEVQEYLFKKKAERAAEKKFIEASQDVIIEAKAIASDPLSGYEEDASEKAARVKVEPVVATLINHDISQNPMTPRVEPSISCSIGDSLFPSIKNMFASVSDPIKVDASPASVQKESMADPSTNRLEAKKRIVKLVEEGWEVSAECCPNPQCELPLFTSNVNGLNIQRFGMCGPRQSELRVVETTTEDLTLKMQHLLMKGWSIVDGGQCPSCHMPTMFDGVGAIHCIACGVLPEHLDQQTVNAAHIFNLLAMHSKLNSFAETAEITNLRATQDGVELPKF